MSGGVDVPQPPPPPPVPISSVPDPMAEAAKANGLSKLKIAFLFYLIGSALSLIPLIGVLGGILDFVGFILLIIGWYTLGKSSFTWARTYRSTGRWLLYSFLAAIVIGVVGVIFLGISLLASLASYYASNPPNATDVLSGPIFAWFLIDVILVVTIAVIPGLFAWNKVRVSMRILAGEIFQPRVGTAGWLFFGVAILGFLNLLTIAATTYVSIGSSTSSVLDIFSSTPFYAAGIGIAAISLTAAILAYTGLKEYDTRGIAPST